MGHADAVQLLVDTPGVDANKVDGAGWTAIMRAACDGHPNIVRVLLAVPGIDLNIRIIGGFPSYRGKTALDLAMGAVSSDPGRWARMQECAALLRAAGAHDEGDFESDNDDDENDEEEEYGWG